MRRKERSRDERFELRKTPTRPSLVVFFVTPRLDEDGKGTKKRKAIVTTNAPDGDVMHPVGKKQQVEAHDGGVTSKTQ